MAVSGGTIIKSTSTQLVWHTVVTGGFLVDDAQIAGQNVRDLNITSVHWSGQWVVTRGANTVLDLIESGDWNLSQMGMSLHNLSVGANVHCVLTGSGTLILEFDKDNQEPGV